MDFKKAFLCNAPVLSSDGHGSPAGKFLPTRARTHRNPYPFVRVRDSRAHGRGYENPYGFGHTKCLADAHQTSIDVGAPAARVLHIQRGVDDEDDPRRRL